MKQLFFFLTLSFFSSITSLAQLKSGLLLSGGIGHLDVELSPSSPIKEIDYIDYRFNAAAGYRFRIEPVQSLLFYDLDVNIGIKKWNSGFGSPYNQGGYSSGSYSYYYTSIGGTVNYPIYKKISIGAGIEPIYYFFQESIKTAIKPALDVPFVAKIGCRLKSISIELSYKYGFCNVVKTEYLSSGKFSDLGFSVYVPF